MISRRTLLALGAGAIVTACGSSKGSSGSSGSDGASTDDAPSTSASAPEVTGFVVVQRYPNTSLTPGAVRLPLSIAGPGGTLLAKGPSTLSGRLLDGDEQVLGDFTAELHGEEMAIPYWPVTADLDTPGIYYLEVEGATGEPVPFQLFEPSAVNVPSVGAALPAFDTPTVDDARGVDPLCTRSEGACPFHEVTLTEALSAGKPVVYIVGTPAHCQTGTCAPGLEYLVQIAPDFADRATFVHAEVYADNAATKVAPAVGAAGLDYEPVIFVTDADGTIVERIDIIWDAEELGGLLRRALS